MNLITEIRKKLHLYFVFKTFVQINEVLIIMIVPTSWSFEKVLRYISLHVESWKGFFKLTVDDTQIYVWVVSAVRQVHFTLIAAQAMFCVTLYRAKYLQTSLS
jgi:hypothetical protein